MLAGTIKPPPLQQEVGLPVAAMPLTTGETLFTRWLSVLSALKSVRGVRVVVNSDRDARLLTASIDPARGGVGAPISAQANVLPPNEVLMEQSSWRGTAGLMRDMAGEIADREHLIVLIEVSMLPPNSLDPILSSLASGVEGVVGSSRDRIPNGVCAFRGGVLLHIPRVGYFDVKEQLLPRLHENGLRVRPALFDERSFRIRDRRTYLEAVHAINAPLPSRAAGGARFEGVCLIDPFAVISEGAIVHDSVVMQGAVVEPEAIVTKSVIGPGARVEGGRRVVREVIAGHGTAERAAMHVARRRAS